MTAGLRERFWQLSRAAFGPGAEQTLVELQEVASLLREQGRHFGAGFAMERSVHAAWGNPELMSSSASTAMEDYDRCIYRSEKCSLEGLAALKKAAQLRWHPYYGSRAELADLRRTADELLQDLAERLVVCGTGQDHQESYLVKGLIVETDLEGKFGASYPDYDVDWNVETWGPEVIEIRVPSAFQLFIALGDYHGAYKVGKLCPDAFTTPALRGWRSAVRGFVESNRAAESFREAAEAFAEDRLPPEGERPHPGRSWSSINVDLWSPYFHSRSHIASACRQPEGVHEYVRAAAQAAPEIRSGWHDPTVTRFVILIRALATLLEDGSVSALQEARRALIGEQRITGRQAGDALVLRFLALAAEALEGFQANPEKEITSGRLPDALGILSRIPLVEPGFAEAVTPALGTQALTQVYGPVRTWIYRTLESINDERELHKIILRLAQASLPAYAQILHGPLEYGKDVVVLLKEDGKRVLRMYQVKTGNIGMKAWREARSQLEEMFLVPLSELNLQSGPMDEREGILVSNGHALRTVVPIMQGWFEEQERDHHRKIRFMHLDDLVQWIQTDRLINEFKAILDELGLEPII